MRACVRETAELCSAPDVACDSLLPRSPTTYSLLYYQGRFALVIEAALHYAKLELGIAPSREEQKEEERRQKEEQKEELRQDRLLGEDGLQNAKQNVCPPKRAKPLPRAAAPLPPPPPRATAAPPRTRG